MQDVKGKLSVISSLQAQLETVEEKLAKSEILLLDHEKVVLEERQKAEKMEREMHVRFSLSWICLVVFVDDVVLHTYYQTLYREMST